MNNENTLTPSDEAALLKITRILAGEISIAHAPAAFSLDLTDEESVAQAHRQARELADRRKAGRGGRALVDDEDTASIREGLRTWLKKTGRIKKYQQQD